MKKIIISLMLSVLTLTAIPVQAFAPDEKVATTIPAPKPTEKESAEANALMMRLNEIKKMDRSKMTAKEKKAVRKELKGIKKRMHAIGGSVYIPVIAVILIVVLLVAFL